jgi:hypothetical protein
MCPEYEGARTLHTRESEPQGLHDSGREGIEGDVPQQRREGLFRGLEGIHAPRGTHQAGEEERVIADVGPHVENLPARLDDLAQRARLPALVLEVVEEAVHRLPQVDLVGHALPSDPAGGVVETVRQR